MNPSICLGIISGGSIKTDTVSCILDCLSHISANVHMSLPIGGYAAESRNMVVGMALKAKDTHILFIDADMVFPSGAAETLMVQDKEIIGVNYHQRKLQPISTVKIEGPDGKFIHGSVGDFPDHTFKVGSIGTGFCLIKTSVFDNVSYPYFRADYINGEFVTEDVYFCLEAKKRGVSVWCDPTIMVHHIGDFQY